MSYIDPPTFVADDTLTAAQLNILSDDIRAEKALLDGLAFEGVSLIRGTNLSVVTATWTDVPWVTSPIDVTGWWTSGASITVPSILVPPGFTQVILECDASARFDANGTGAREIQWVLNGGVVERAFSTSALTGDTTPVQIGPVWAVAAAGDVLKVQVYQSSGGNLNCSHANAHVKRIGYM